MSDNIGSFLKKITDTKNTVPKIYSKTVLSNITKQKLLSYQENHVVRLVNILLKYSVGLDASDTGIGKTYVAAATCKELDRRPIIVCPKTLIFNWMCVLAFFGVKHYDIVNYETLKNGKTYRNDKCKSRIKSPFVDVVDPDPENPLKFPYEWHVPKDAIVIFDEAHRCKDPSTDNGKLLASTKQLILQKIPVIMLSATICEKFTDMKIPFYLFGFIPNTRNFNHYVKTLRQKYPQHKVKRSNYQRVSEYKDAREHAQAMTIYEEIKDFTSRIKIKDLGDKFPSNQWCAQQFIAEEADKISEAYEEMAVLMKALKDNPGKNDLAKIQKLKQEIEFRKVPIFIEQAQLFLDEGKSVIIFVNYLDTLHIIAEQLDIRCKIFGDQTMEERQNAIDMFQSNEERIIICQMRAGGVGISLHDIHGGHPRVTLINYPDSASDLLQALGRAPRSGAKTPVLQRIIFVANVDYEKRIMQNINKKLANISAINDGDLDGYKYKIYKITRKVVPKKEIKKVINIDDESSEQ
ncbi:DEAD/SNF2 helicase [Tupanvirus soda lake]|uniref:DEAD/SNF2 helicase n=2 Tax=Tupanvirus TaxID=2094720 RepID=A0A6N1NKD5_9VIRU|nr:DEAD/SNF2 helicase [Tupanvirus soda lake]QKU35179.1 DEAD/SNF2 helicase [Tupanvirus soda lake]